MSKNNKILPEWLQELWVLDPSLARKAEKHMEEVGADIRNKLTPPNNLIALLNNFKIEYKGDDINGRMDEILKKEIKNVEFSVDYLKNLL